MDINIGLVYSIPTIRRVIEWSIRYNRLRSGSIIGFGFNIRT